MLWLLRLNQIKVVSAVLKTLQVIVSFSMLIVMMMHCLWTDIRSARKRGISVLDMLRGFYRLMTSKPYLASVHEVIRKEGYDMEEHTVQTSDGYLLKLFRVKARSPRARSDPTVESGSRGAVLLQHGLLQTCMPYILNGRDRALAFILADEGFDVWLGNNRGNLHSRRHVHLSSDDDEFWNFSIDDLALDVEASVDHIRDVTGEAKVYYVGHSQGSAQGLMAFSTNPQLASKIRLFVALSPGAYVQKFDNWWMQKLCNSYSVSPALFFALFGTGSFLPELELMREKILGIRLFSFFAYSMFHFLFGWSDAGWDKSREPLYFNETPSGTTSRIIAHWMQSSATGRLARYDFGPEENLNRYGSVAAPDYDLSKIGCPTAVIYGGKDRLSDFNQLLTNLGKQLVHSQRIDHHEHMCSLASLDCPRLLYPQMITLLRSY